MTHRLELWMLQQRLRQWRLRCHCCIRRGIQLGICGAAGAAPRIGHKCCCLCIPAGQEQDFSNLAHMRLVIHRGCPQHYS